MGKIKFQLNFYLRTDGSQRNGGMKENLFRCGHVNITLYGKMKRQRKKKRSKIWTFFFFNQQDKSMISQRIQQKLDLKAQEELKGVMQIIPCLPKIPVNHLKTALTTFFSRSECSFSDLFQLSSYGNGSICQLYFLIQIFESFRNTELCSILLF